MAYQMLQVLFNIVVKMKPCILLLRGKRVDKTISDFLRINENLQVLLANDNVRKEDRIIWDIGASPVQQP